MARRIIHIRHGESTNNDLFRRTGSKEGRLADPLLSELGHRQVARVAQAVAADPALRGAPVWASPTGRAVQTAAAVATALGSDAVVLVPDLVEGGGVYERVDGQRVAAAPRSFEALLAAAPGMSVHWDAPESSSWSGGFETFDETPGRAHRILERLRAHDAENVLVVGHEWFGQHLIRAAMGLPPAAPDAGGWFDLPNAGITELRLTPRGADLVRCGDVHHLGPLARPTVSGADA